MRQSLFALAVSLAILPPTGRAGEKNALTVQQTQFFETKVRPILADHCFPCHGPKKQQAGIRLDSRGALLIGGEHGPIVVPGNPGKSTLVGAVRYTGAIKMPPKGKLPPRVIEDLTVWVAMGAPWPEEDGPTT